MGAEQALPTLVGFTDYAAVTLPVLEFVGTIVFAPSGATAGVRYRLDVFGVPIVSFAAV